MEEKIEALNCDIKWFLSNLSIFRETVNTSNHTTMKLLGETVDLIADFVDETKIVETRKPMWPKMDDEEDVFLAQRSFICCVCNISFPASTVDYQLHVYSEKHKYSFEKEIHNAIHPYCVSTLIEEEEGESDLFEAQSHENGNRFSQNAVGGCTFRPNEQSLLYNLLIQPTKQKGVDTATQTTPISPLPRKVDSCASSQLDELISKNFNSFTANRTLPFAPKFMYLKAFFEIDFDTFITNAMNKANKINNRSLHMAVATSMQKLLHVQSMEPAEFHLIGSRLNKTTFDDNASLDICFDFGNTDGIVSYSNCMIYMQNLLNIDSTWSNVKSNKHRAHCGILFATHKASKTDCRIIFDGEMFVQHNNVFKHFLNKQRCRPLILIIRTSMERLNAPNWTKKFSGYIISMLVLFYFQVTNRYPALQDLADLNAMDDVPTCQDSVSTLLVGFFGFYTSFEFEKNIISVYEGGPISRTILHTSNRSLKPSIVRFKELMESDMTVWQKGNMCIQDILLHSNNVTESINASDIDEFKAYCRESLKVVGSGLDVHKY